MVTLFDSRADLCLTFTVLAHEGLCPGGDHIHHAPVFLSLLVTACCRPQPNLVFLLQIILGAAGADWYLGLVPVTVVFQGIQNILGIRMDEVSPGLPQRMHYVVYESNLKYFFMLLKLSL